MLAALAVLVSLWLWFDTGVELPSGESAHQVLPSVAAAAETLASAPTREGTAVTPEPEAEPEPEPEPVDLSLPYAFTLRVRVVDLFGLPVEGAHVFVAPRRCAFGVLPDATDARGVTRFACRGKAWSLPLWVAVMVHGTVEPLRMVTLTADAEASLVIAARGRFSDPKVLLDALDSDVSSLGLRYLSHRVVNRTRQRESRTASDPKESPRGGRLLRWSYEDTVCGRELMLWRGIECLVCHEAKAVASYPPLRWAAQLPSRGVADAVFHDMLQQQPADRDRKELDDRLAADQPDESVRRLEQEFTAARLGTCRGRVTTDEGKPAIGVQVVWLAGDGAVRTRTSTNDDGRYALVLPGNDPCTVVAAGGQLGRAEAVVAVPAGGDGDQDFVLQAQETISGRASDHADAALAGWHVHFVGTDDGGGATTDTDSNGRFRFTSVPRGGRCFLMPADADLRLPVVATDMVLSNTANVVLRLDQPTRSILRLRPQLPQGHQGARVELRVVQLGTDFAAHVAAGQDGNFDLGGLPPGDYEGELGAQGLGWVPFGPVHLDGRGTWDLGPIPFDLPGSVRFVVPARGTSPLAYAPTFVALRGDLHAVVSPIVRKDGTVLLPAGDYALLWLVDGVTRQRTFHVDIGKETVVRT